MAEAIAESASEGTRRTCAVTAPVEAPLPSQTLTRDSRVPSTLNSWAAALPVPFTLKSALSWRTCPSYGAAVAAATPGSPPGAPASSP